MNRKELFYRSGRVSFFLTAGLYITALAVSVISNFIFTSSLHNQVTPFLIIFGDGMVPLLLSLGALIFRSRSCAIAAVTVTFFSIFLRLGSVVIFKETFMPLDYFALKLLFIHTDLEAAQAVLGEYFYLWLIPAALMIVASISYCCILIWKTAGKETKKVSRFSMIILLPLLLLSIISNIAFPFIRNIEQEQVSVTPMPIIFYELTRDFVDDVSSEPLYEPIPLPQKSREILMKEGVISVENEKDAEDLFDRIIIIALESFDYHYIGKNNPEMPQNITPNLDRLSREYVSMDNYFAAAQPTSWGLTALLLSRLDYERDKILPTTSLFTAAQEKGFYTFYFSSSPGYFEQNMNNYLRIFKPDTQFFREEFFEKYGYGVENEWGLSDRTLFNGVYEELEASSAERFIAVISTIDTHFPYHNCGLSEKEENIFQNNFLKALFSTDRETNTFLQKIMQNPKLYNERTLIIVTADHTATHGENYTKRKNFSPERIPLIFISPNQKIFKSLDTKKYASSIDLPPTLLKLIGGKIPESFMGRDLFSDKNRAVTTSHGPFLKVYSPEKELTINMNKPEDDLQTAYRDFYYSFYGK